MMRLLPPFLKSTRSWFSLCYFCQASVTWILWITCMWQLTHVKILSSFRLSVYWRVPGFPFQFLCVCISRYRCVFGKLLYNFLYRIGHIHVIYVSLLSRRSPAFFVKLLLSAIYYYRLLGDQCSKPCRRTSKMHCKSHLLFQPNQRTIHFLLALGDACLLCWKVST